MGNQAGREEQPQVPAGCRSGHRWEPKSCTWRGTWKCVLLQRAVLSQGCQAKEMLQEGWNCQMERGDPAVHISRKRRQSVKC